MLFLTFRVLNTNPKKQLFYTVANPAARGLVNREKRTKQKRKSGSASPPPQKKRCSFGENNVQIFNAVVAVAVRTSFLAVCWLFVIALDSPKIYSTSSSVHILLVPVLLLFHFWVVNHCDASCVCITHSFISFDCCLLISIYLCFYFAVCCIRCPCPCLHAWVVSHRLWGYLPCVFYANASRLFLLSVCFCLCFLFYRDDVLCWLLSCPFSSACFPLAVLNESKFASNFPICPKS